MLTKRTMDELNRMDEKAFRDAPKLSVVLVLDNIRSGLNVGSIFRSADAFRISEIVCCGITPSPLHREVLKTALGATATVAWRSEPDTVATIFALKNSGFQIVAIEQCEGSMLLHDWKPVLPIALVLGNEVHGVQEEALASCDLGVEIAQYGTKHSLNVAVAAGVVLHHLAVSVAS